MNEARAEEDERRREERLRIAVENAGDVILVLSTEGEIVEFNSAAERFFGVSRESVLGKEYIAQFVPEQERAASREDAKRILAGLPLRGRLRPVAVAGGRPRYLSWNVDRFLDSSGRPAGVVACGRDVTQQKELEDRVLVSIATGISASTGQELFRHLAGRLMEILEADYVTIGKLEDKGGRRRIRTIAHFADGALAEDTVYDLEGSPCDEVVAGKLCSFAEGVKNLFPGDPILMDWGVEGYVGAPLFDSSEQVQGLVNAFFKAPIRDVSLSESILRIFAARASGELERLVAVEELRRIIEAIPGGMVQAASDGSIVLANEQAQHFLHLAHDGGSGSYRDRLLDQAFVTEDGAPCPRGEEPLNRCLATGIPEPPRVMGIIRPDGLHWGSLPPCLSGALPAAARRGRF